MIDIYDMFRNCTDLSEENFKNLWNGTKGNNGLYRYLNDEIISATIDQTNNKKHMWEAFCNAVDRYISSYPASPAVKQRKYLILINCLNKIKTEFGFEGNEYQTDSITEPCTKDTTTEFIKLLHNRNGITKRELSENLGISTRQIQGYVESFNAAGDKRSGQKTTLRFAGQSVYGTVSSNRINNKEKTYMMPSTIHPVALQMNVMQTFVMLRSLYVSYKEGISDVSYRLAIDVWAQLSDYCKNRIYEVFGSIENDFDEFLDDLEKDLESFTESGYMDEYTMCEEGYVNIRDELSIAMKCGYHFKILIKQEKEIIELDDCATKEFVDNERVVLCVNEKNPFLKNEKITVKISDIVSI